MDWKDKLLEINMRARERKELFFKEAQQAHEAEREDSRLIEALRPQVEEVFEGFIKALPPAWKKNSKEGTFSDRLFGECVHHKFYYEKSERSFRAVSEFHDTRGREHYHAQDVISISISSRITLGSTVFVEARRYFSPPAYISQEFFHKYSLYNNSPTNSISIKIPLKDFTREKLAEILVDIFEAE